MENVTLTSVAADYEAAAAELERAARHLRTTARHIRDGDVPRGCAHAWAALGHMRRGEARMDALAELHATKSEPG